MSDSTTIAGRKYRGRRRVEFADTDMGGIVHFSRFFRYMEEVEHEFFRSLGLSVFMESDDGVVTWPRVATSIDFIHPLRFEDVLDIELSITRIGRSSLTYEVKFSSGGREIGAGKMTIVCCERKPDGRFGSIEIPDSIRTKLLP